MALDECTLNLDRTLRELCPHGTIEFPCARFSRIYTDKAVDEIPWHWHEDLEFIYIAEGTMLVQLPAADYLLEKGQGIFINSGIMHRAIAKPLCMLHSLVFSAGLLTGTGQSVFAQKYINPLLRCLPLGGSLLSFENELGKICLHHFLDAFQALDTGEFGFEFTVREKLSLICLSLYEHNRTMIDQGHMGHDLYEMRVRRMLDYLHEHFAEPILLSQIAQVVGIGERECLRCFKRVIRISPMQYLLKYRIMQGAAMLTEHPEHSVAEISIRCGFDSPSNFSKLFKRFFKCSPKVFLKNQKFQQESSFVQ